MTLDIIDTHAHLDMPEFDTDREDVIKRAADSGVTRIITIGINPESNRRAINLAENHPGIWAAIGIHPQESKSVTQKVVEELVIMAGHPRVVAIGELGLDYFRDYVSHREQLDVLRWELEAASKTGLPAIIHCRQAQDDMLAMLREWCNGNPSADGKPRGVLHCFSGDRNLAETYLKLGFYLSIGAYISYPSSAPLRETLKTLPVDRLVVETDCPFLPPQKYRGKRNEPSYTLFTLEVLAEVKGMSLEEIARQTTLNAMQVFNLS